MHVNEAVDSLTAPLRGAQREQQIRTIFGQLVAFQVKDDGGRSRAEPSFECRHRRERVRQCAHRRFRDQRRQQARATLALPLARRTAMCAERPA